MHRLGQADKRTTARYVHVLDETGESAARRFEGLLPSHIVGRKDVEVPVGALGRNWWPSSIGAVSFAVEGDGLTGHGSASISISLSA